MKTVSNGWQEVLPRRSVISSAALALGAAALAALGAGTATAQAKVSKAVVAYQDTPKGDQRCDNCALFQPPNGCKTIGGDIAPEGWCKIWQHKPD